MQGSTSEIKIKRIEPTSFVFNQNHEHKLGAGAFGDVFLGFDEVEMKPVAVKTISFEKLQNSAHHSQGNLMEKLKTEIINMQIAKSQHLVQLVSANSSTRNLYMVCEFCNGGSLKEYLKTQKYLTEPEALTFFTQILESFRFLNEKKIVHRDLKPANILLHNFRIKIGDLGFSKSIEMHDQFLESMVGSPMYMSPQILSNQKYTEKTDIWSLGVIMYEMLYGDGPWKVVTSLNDIKEKVKKKIQFPKNFHTSTRTKKLILSMLQYEENQRICWQQLFKQYLVDQQSEMMDENQGNFPSVCRKISKFYKDTVCLEREDQIIRILIQNKLKYTETTGQNNNSVQFFKFFYQIENYKGIINQIQQKFFEARNQIAYLMKIFFMCLEIAQKIHHPLFYEIMFLLLRFCLIKLNQLMNQNYEEVMHREFFLKTSFYLNRQQLLNYDFEILQHFYKVFFNQFYSVGMASDFGQNQLFKEDIQKNLKGLYEQLLGEDKFIQHLLHNSIRRMFNFLRTINEQNESIFFLSRFLYELQKTNNLFSLGNKKNILKVIEQWRNDKKWPKRLLELPNFQIESIGTFLNREIKWVPYQFTMLQE